MTKEIDRRLGLQKAGAMLPCTVFDADGAIAGMTTYMNVDAANRRVEIGSTWYAKRVQRSALNTQCKLLAAAACVRKARLHRGRIPHPFLQSSEPPRASSGSGHKQDGILRNHQIAPERHVARHRGLQHHRQRMADGEGASELSTEREGAVTKAFVRHCEEQATKHRPCLRMLASLAMTIWTTRMRLDCTNRTKVVDGNFRLRHRRRRIGRQRAGQPAERGPGQLCVLEAGPRDWHPFIHIPAGFMYT